MLVLMCIFVRVDPGSTLLAILTFRFFLHVSTIFSYIYIFLFYLSRTVYTSKISEYVLLRLLLLVLRPDLASGGVRCFTSTEHGNRPEHLGQKLLLL